MANGFLLKPVIPAAIIVGSAPAIDFTTGALQAGVGITRAAGPYSKRGSNGSVVKGSDANSPRFDFDPPVNGGAAACRGLMLEPARSNLIPYAEQFDQWAKDQSGTAAAVTANATTAPDGTQTADRIDLPAISSGGRATLYQSNGPGAIVTEGVWLRGASGGEVVYIIAFDSGGQASSVQCNLTTAWQRFSVASSTAAGTVYFFLGVDLRFAGTAQPAQSFFAWGASYEVGAQASSYILTTTGAATRPAETLTIPTGSNSGTQDVLLTYSDGTTETRTGTVSNGTLSLPASNVPRVIAKAQLAASVSTVQVGALTNLLNDYAGIIATLGGGNQAIIVVDLGADTAIDTALMFGVELFPASGGLTVDYATAAQGAFTGAYTSDASAAAYAGSTPLSNGKGVSFWATATPVTARYVRFTYAAAGASVRLSRLVIGKRFQPTRNFSYGAGFGVRDLGSLDFSRRGVLLRARGAKLRTAQVTYSFVQKDEAEQSVKPLLEYLGNTECVALVTDPAADPQRQNRCYFGPLVGDVGQVWKTSRSWEVKINLVSVF